jgi:hypothetical protein
MRMNYKQGISLRYLIDSSPSWKASRNLLQLSLVVVGCLLAGTRKDEIDIVLKPWAGGQEKEIWYRKNLLNPQRLQSVRPPQEILRWII